LISVLELDIVTSAISLSSTVTTVWGCSSLTLYSMRLNHLQSSNTWVLGLGSAAEGDDLAGIEVRISVDDDADDDDGGAAESSVIITRLGVPIPAPLDLRFRVPDSLSPDDPSSSVTCIGTEGLAAEELDLGCWTV
jgi:hypothetical protein